MNYFQKKAKEITEELRTLKANKKDPFAGWKPHERLAIQRHAELKRREEEYRIDQMLDKHIEKKILDKKRALADIQVKLRYSHINEKTIEAVIQEYELQDSPAGRLAACRILEAEGKADKPEPVELPEDISEEIPKE